MVAPWRPAGDPARGALSRRLVFGKVKARPGLENLANPVLLRCGLANDLDSPYRTAVTSSEWWEGFAGSVFPLNSTIQLCETLF